jgi:hypothetical protein
VLFPFALGCREIGGWVREFLAPLAAALQGDMDATLPREPVMGRIHAVIPSRDDSAAMGAMATPPEPSF